jgi:hypothetical protein
MRAILFVVLLGGCFGAKGGGGGGSRPGVMPMLSELPGDAEKRNAILDSSNHTAGPEHRKGMTKKERKAETGAATAAAIIGSMFSNTQNVTLGTATTFDENEVVAPQPMQPPSPKQESSGSGADGREPEAKPVVPWIDLGRRPK